MLLRKNRRTLVPSDRREQNKEHRILKYLLTNLLNLFNLLNLSTEKAPAISHQGLGLLSVAVNYCFFTSFTG